MTKGSRWRFAWAWCIGAVLILWLPSCGDLPIDLPDSDGDGIPDVLDPCPADPNPACMPAQPPPEPYDCSNPPALAGLVKVRRPIKDRYIAVFKPDRAVISAEQIVEFASKFGGVSEVQPLHRAFAAKVEVSALFGLLADPAIKFVQQDGIKSLPKPVAGEATAALSWGLDRIDDREGLDGKFEPPNDCSQVHAFVIDTGCPTDGSLTSCSQTHPDFGARYDPVCHSQVTFQGCSDAHGHATHVSGTIGGTKYGVCKGITLHAERVLDANGSGTDTGVIAGINNVADWKRAHAAIPVVANLSLGGDPAPALDQAVCDAIAVGVTFGIAAGNSSEDAYLSSPARVVQAITVGASDRNDTQAYFSNYGPGLDLYSPGVDIESDTPTGGSAVFSGTSMSAPHIVGGAALLLQEHPGESPEQVRDRMVEAATKDTLEGIGSGSPNLFLFVGKEEEGSVPPKGEPVGREMLLRTDGARLKTIDGVPVLLNTGVQCCQTLTPQANVLRRPAPLRVKGEPINSLWPLISEPAQDYFRMRGATNAYHFRLGPFYADAETEVDWVEYGGPYLEPGGAWNPRFWAKVRELAWHAYKARSWVEVVVIDTWGCKYSQWGNRYVSWPADAIEACGRTWHPEHERYARKVVEELGCFGAVIWGLDNEGVNIPGHQAAWFEKLYAVIDDEETLSGCGFDHIRGTGVDGVSADYSITHSKQPLTAPLHGRWTHNNERNPADPPAEDTARFEAARNLGLGWALWRNGWTDAEFEDALARRKAVVEGGGPTPPPCTLGTPTAREMAAAGKNPTINVQRTTAGYGPGVDPRAGKWISGTPRACFGRAYYCAIGWKEACDEGLECGPVAPEGHPERVACEARFLEAPCPTFSMASCTGTGEQCPITWDPYIVIDGINQNHPDNVKAGCRESTWTTDPNGRVLSGEWWKATAHGKGYLKACNFDGSVCGVSTFVIDQGFE